MEKSLWCIKLYNNTGVPNPLIALAKELLRDIWDTSESTWWSARFTRSPKDFTSYLEMTCCLTSTRLDATMPTTDNPFEPFSFDTDTSHAIYFTNLKRPGASRLSQIEGRCTEVGTEGRRISWNYPQKYCTLHTLKATPFLRHVYDFLW